MTNLNLSKYKDDDILEYICIMYRRNEITTGKGFISSKELAQMDRNDEIRMLNSDQNELVINLEELACEKLDLDEVVELSDLFEQVKNTPNGSEKLQYWAFDYDGEVLNEVFNKKPSAPRTNKP